MRRSVRTIISAWSALVAVTATAQVQPMLLNRANGQVNIQNNGDGTQNVKFAAGQLWLGGIQVTIGTAANNVLQLDGSGKIPLTTLPNSGVTAGTYGDATHTLTVTVDIRGRVTGMSQSAISAEAPLTFSPPLSRVGATISLAAATTTVDGYLAHGDFVTFNNKQNAITTGTTAQYFRGDLSLATLNKAAVAGLHDNDDVTFAYISTSGTSAGVLFKERDSVGTDFIAYATGGYYRLYNGTDRLTLSPTGTLAVTGDVNIAASHDLLSNSVQVLRLNDNTNTVLNPILSSGRVYLNYDRGAGISFGDGSGGVIGNISNAGNLSMSGTLGGSNFSGSSSGTNTGDQIITLTGDVTGTGTGSFAASITNSSVTLAKMANMATSSLIYRKTAGAGPPEVNSLATLKTDLLLTGTNSGDVTLAGQPYITISGQVITASAVDLSGANATGILATARLPGFTGGDVTSSAASLNLSIANSAVTLAKMANVATGTVFYRKTAGTGAPEVQTLSTLKTDMLLNNVENTALSTWAGSTSLTTLGTIGTGTWQGTTIAGAYGGTGVSNSGKTITLGGNLTTSGAFATTLTVTATTNVTLPITGTVSTLAGAEAFTNKDFTGSGNTWPIFNQSTTGSAAKWTTARNLAGNSVDGSATVAFANKFIVQGTADTGLSAAQFMGALATGIIKNTTTTGVFSIAVAGDFPTLNQNTTGNANTATALQNARTIGGVSFDGTTNITVATATGGFTVSGGNLALTTNSITMTGSLGSTGSRLTKGWFTDLESTNAIVGSITGSAPTLTTPRNIGGASFNGSADATLDTIEGVSSNGFPARTSTNTRTIRQMTGTTNQITVTNPAGILGDPNFSIPANAQLSIAKITNLTTAGYVKTSGIDGTLIIDTAGGVPTSRVINTTSPLLGGGDLSADRTFSLAGLSGLGTANQIVGMNNAATAYEYKTFAVANGVTITDAANSKTFGLAAITPTTVTASGLITANAGINIAAGFNLSASGNTVVQTADNSNTVINPVTTGGSVYLNWTRGTTFGTVFGDGAANVVGRVDIVGNARFGDHTVGVQHASNFAPNVVFEGDSITQAVQCLGNSSCSGGTPNGYNNYMGAAAGANPDAQGHNSNFTAAAIGTVNGISVSPSVGQNVAVAGKQSWELLETSYRVNNLYRQEALNVLVYLAGTNDMGVGGYSYQQTYEHIAASLKHFRAMGWKIVLVGCISRGDGVVSDANINNLNALLAQNEFSICDRFIDWRIVGGGTNEFYNTAGGGVGGGTWYNADRLHPSYAGSRKLAQYAVPYINDLLTYYFFTYRNQLIVSTNNGTTHDNTFPNQQMMLHNENPAAGQTSLAFTYNIAGVKTPKQNFRGDYLGNLNIGSTLATYFYVGSTGPDVYGTNGSDGPPPIMALSNTQIITYKDVAMQASTNLLASGNSVLRLDDNTNTVVNPITGSGALYLNWTRGATGLGTIFGNGAVGTVGRFSSAGGLNVGGSTDPGAGNLRAANSLAAFGTISYVAGTPGVYIGYDGTNGVITSVNNGVAVKPLQLYGNPTSFFNSAGTLNVTLVDDGSITFRGHLGSNQAAPSIVKGAQCGSTGAVSFGTNSTDSSGLISITPGGTGIAAGHMATVTFTSAYTNSPHVVVSSVSNATAIMQPYYSDNTTTFAIWFVGTPASGTTYVVSYHVQGQ